MNARQVHAILAYGVKNPHLISDWQKSGGVNDQLLLPDTFDFGTFARFAGLSVKVRHNGLRQFYPLSFRVMNAGSVDIELFASYAQHNSHCNLRLEDDLTTRATRLMEFYEAWRDDTNHTHNILRDVFRHEHAIVSVQSEAAILSYEPKKTSHPTIGFGSVLKTTPGLRMQHLNFEPEIVEDHLNRNSNLEKVKPADTYFGYLPSGCGRVLLLRLDTASFNFLGSIDGEISLYELGQKFKITNEELLIRLANQLVGQGFIHQPSSN